MRINFKRLDITELATSQVLPIFSGLTSKSKSVVFLITGLFLVLVVGTVSQQLNGVGSVYAAERNLVAQQIISPPRGLFYDRNGVRLVTNRSSYGLLVKKSDYDEVKLNSLLDKLSTIVPFDRQATVDRFKSGDDTHVLLVGGLSNDQKLLFESVSGDSKYSLVDYAIRDYDQVQYYSHIIGYTGLASADDVKAGAGARDIVGKYRLEKLFNTELSGVKGKVVNQLGGDVTFAEVPGNNIVLTINDKWQHALYNILGRQVDSLGAIGGGAAIIDISNGDVMAHVSYPTFDPNMFTKGMTDAEYKALLEDPRQPLIDKVASTQIAPGSSFKIVTSYVLLENGIIDDTTHVFSTGCMQISAGFPFCEFGKYYLGDLDLKRALTRSSNIFFCENILKMVGEKGFSPFVDYAKQLGMGQLTGSGLDQEVAGVLASPEYKLQTFKQGWFLGDACNAVIGQGFTVVTPLQMAMMISTIANGGSYYKPNYVKQIQDQTGAVIKSGFTQLLRTIPLKPETQSLILEGMRQVVTSPEGTAYWHLHAMPGNFRGKSGSAQAFVYENGRLVEKVNGWLIGTFEYEGKTYGFSAEIALGGGGWNVSQVMQRFANCLFSNFAPQCEFYP